MTYDVSTVEEYVAALPEDRREPFERLRRTIRDHLPDGFEEALSYKLPSFVVPHSRYPEGYHCRPEEPLPFLSIASQKGYIGFYHSGLYSMPDLLDWFTTAWADRDIGRLDMGKSCVRFRKMDRIPHDLIGELCQKVTVDEWIAVYETAIKR